MKRAIGLLLAGVLGVGVLAAIVISIPGRTGDAPRQQLTVLRGVIGSGKQPFFSDPEVIRIFHNHGLDVKVDRTAFNTFVTSHKVVLPQTLFNVIEPPSYEALESMISAIEQHMKGATP